MNAGQPALGKTKLDLMVRGCGVRKIGVRKKGVKATSDSAIMHPELTQHITNASRPTMMAPKEHDLALTPLSPPPTCHTLCDLL